MKKAIIYDFDKTIYNGETSIDFMIFFLKKKPILIFKFLFFSFLILFNLNSLTKTKNLFFKVLKNYNLKEDIKEFWEKNKNKFFSYFKDEIEKNKKEADILILISASPDFLLQDIYKDLGFDILIATKYEKYTMISKNCKNQEKLNRLKLLGDFDVIAFYSDSISDKPLYDIAKRKYTINKKGEVLEGLPNKTKWIDKWI
ncbi:HAD family hydrolase [Caviibacter abscessus]|uniref:HAD family hydrolase n=1 Tax=Caviibacter abscessus TaxID=1766719 RepID=UPI00082D5FBA|nr:HAD family hydrolase [Caviibacter abscessus]